MYATSGAGGVYRIDGDAFTPCPEPAAPLPPGVPRPPATGRHPPPVVTLGAARRQRVLRQKGFRLAMSCNELCGTTAQRTDADRPLEAIYMLKPQTRQLAAGQRVTLTLRRRSAALAAVRAALRRHRTVSATLTVVGRDRRATGAAPRSVVTRAKL